MTVVGFEPTQLALVELESTPLDHSGKLSLVPGWESKILRAGSAYAHAALRKWNLSPPPWTTWARCRGFLAESQDSPRRQRLTPWQPDVCMCLQLCGVRSNCGRDAENSRVVDPVARTLRVSELWREKAGLRTLRWWILWHCRSVVPTKRTTQILTLKR